MIRTNPMYGDLSLRCGENPHGPCGHGRSATNGLASWNGEKPWRRARRSAYGLVMNRYQHVGWNMRRPQTRGDAI